MNGIEYFSTITNWSLEGLLLVVAIWLCYTFVFKATKLQNLQFSVLLLLFYIGFGSPLADLPNYGMHSVSMFQHIILLMIAPVLFLKAIPQDSRLATRLNSVFSGVNKYFMFVWIVGAIAMWGGHFLSAGIYSAKLGTSICGISLPATSWIKSVPLIAVDMVLFAAGLLCNMPVFHPNPKKRLKAVQSVAYLFSSCLVCSVLGLYVAFSATSAAMIDAAPVFTTLRNPVAMSVRTDQELAGMLMWVPGCILYIIASIEIVLTWFNEPALEKAKNVSKLRVIK